LSLTGSYGYPDVPDTVLDLIHLTSGTITGAFNTLPVLSSGWEILETSTDVFLENAPPSVPEPAPYLLIGGAIMALGLIRRRRSRTAA
jgi:hypothetical protein